MAAVIYLALAVAVGYWNYTRGNSFILGLIIALIATPILAAIFVAITKKNPAKLEKRTVKSGEMKKCPACAELVRADARKCRFCGTEIVMTWTIGGSGK